MRRESKISRAFNVANAKTDKFRERKILRFLRYQIFQPKSKHRFKNYVGWLNIDLISDRANKIYLYQYKVNGNAVRFVQKVI